MKISSDSGRRMADASGAPSLMNTPCIPYRGMPRVMLTVPSMGSRAQVRPSTIASGEDSSAMIASSENAERIAPMTFLSTATSISVTAS